MDGKQYFLPQLKCVYADGAYQGKKFAQKIYQQTNWQIQVIKRSDKKTFVPIAKRWIVERTFAWINKNRRMSKDYELKLQSSEAMICLTMIRLMLRRFNSNH